MYIPYPQFKYRLSLFYLNSCLPSSLLWNTGLYLLWVQHQSWSQSPFKLHHHRSSPTSPIQIQSPFRHNLNTYWYCSPYIIPLYGPLTFTYIGSSCHDCSSVLAPMIFFLAKVHVQYNPPWFILQLFSMSIWHMLIISPLSHTVYCPVNLSLLNMSTLATVKLLVKTISVLSNSLSDAVLKGSKDDKIWSVMNIEECDTPNETFNRWFNALFVEDWCNPDGHIHHVYQGKLRMSLLVPYLLKINWTSFLIGSHEDQTTMSHHRAEISSVYIKFSWWFYSGAFHTNKEG